MSTFNSDKSRPVDLSLLRESPIFSSLPDSELIALRQLLSECSFSAGSVLFHSDEPGDSCYVIASGTVEILRGSGAQERLLARLERTAVVGEGCLLRDTQRTATARAQTEVTALKLSRADFDLLLEEDNLGAYRMVLAIAAEVHKRLQANNELLYGLLLGPQAEGADEREIDRLRRRFSDQWSLY